MADARLHIAHTEASCGWGGQEIRILTEAEGMRQRGHRVVLLCPKHAPIHAAALKRAIPVVALPIERQDWRGFRALRHWLRQHPEIDIVNTHSSTDSWLVAIACATLRRPPVIVRTRHVSTTVHNNWPTRWLYQRATRHIVTTGEALKQQLVRDNGFEATRITSVPTGIDLERYRPQDKPAARTALGLAASGHYLGIVATLRNWKGHVYLLEAFAELAPKFPDWRLLMVGDGPQRHNLERLVETLQLRERVLMPGNRDDVPLWLNSMDLFVLPSYGEEGVSQSVMQAMACGLPVVSTTVGAIAEAVTHEQTGLLVAPRDVAGLKAAIARLMQEPALRANFGAAGRARAQERFGVERMREAMESVFRHALEERHACAA
jgi:glycosyltransferase involved in cell wall biosynthesis